MAGEEGGGGAEEPEGALAAETAQHTEPAGAASCGGRVEKISTVRATVSCARRNAEGAPQAGLFAADSLAEAASLRFFFRVLAALSPEAER